ncbi:MlaD family protein [Deferribacterales bacterium Es71-Z0220]|uniref:MlaD family protein n=1 Tax=Deferrivibrio essentukiensis TaxID=2880922 RepID=UPI001F61616B|nr:MlaD family protein [Deferrivibrio essentukiensis]MCB4205553.1 MlaD family protein [Deferrivibrio essentukiensis]
MADPRFKNLEFKVGLFVLAAFTIIAVVFVLIGINKKVFVKKTKIFINSSSGEGVKKGMPVIFSGFQIARVDSVNLKDTGEVVMKVSIPNNYAKWIKVDSTAKLASQNFIGSSSIVFEGGAGEQIKDGAEFFLKRDKGLDEIIEKAKPVMDDMKVIVENLRIITDKLADDNGSFNIFMRGLAALGSDLQNKEGSMGYLLRSDYLKDETAKIILKLTDFQDKLNKVASNAVNTTDELDRKIKAFDIENVNQLIGISKKLAENINDKVAKIDPILANVSKISKDVSEATDNVSQMRRDVDYILNNTNELILNLGDKWPFNADNEKEVRKLKIP